MLPLLETLVTPALLAASLLTNAAPVTLPFRYPFTVDGRLDEVGIPENSSSRWWWLSSGGYMQLTDGAGQTNQGETDSVKWQDTYLNNNPVDTDNGHHPQNIFRLLFRTAWRDTSSAAYFTIHRNNLSASPNRNASNGLLFMSRYADQDDLYYGGLRVDGRAVIKKKYHGEYTSLYDEPFIEGKYNRATEPNLLPLGKKIGIKLVTRNLDDGSVQLILYADIGRTGDWKLAASAIDDGTALGPPFLGSGHVGIRTDFMDVEFDDFWLNDA